MRLKIISEEDDGDGFVRADINIQTGIKNKVYTYKVNEWAWGLSKVLINRDHKYGLALHILTKYNIMERESQ